METGGSWSQEEVLADATDGVAEGEGAEADADAADAAPLLDMSLNKKKKKKKPKVSSLPKAREPPVGVMELFTSRHQLDCSGSSG